MTRQYLNDLPDRALIARAIPTAVAGPELSDIRNFMTGTVFVYDGGYLWRASKGGRRAMMRNDGGLLSGERKHLIAWLRRNPA